MKIDHDFVSIETVAIEFNVTVQAVYGWIKSGDLKAISESVSQRQRHKICRKSLAEFRTGSRKARLALLRINRKNREFRANRVTSYNPNA